MKKWFSRFIDDLSEYFSSRKGLLPLVGLSMVVINLVLQIFPAGWVTQSNLFLHLGLIVAILGMMLSWAL